MNGNDLASYKDPNGKLLFVDFVNAVKKDGSGFVPYEWPKPGFDKPQPKLSYVVGFAPWNWVIGTGVYIDDLQAQTWVSTQRSLIVAGAILLFMLAVSIFVARSITAPLQRMTVTMNDLASGKLDVEVPGVGRGDEVGEMAKAVEVFKSNAVARQSLETEQRAAESRAVASRKADMNKMADDFEAAVGRIVETVSSASSQLEVSAGTLTATAERAQVLTTTVAAASEEASTNVQSVASATEEMASSVTEISRQVQESARMANDAVGQARTTNDRVSELSKAATRIGDVVELINTIAGQTNLLALNATIEAARAGEAGRGFAVVASEVKSLAGQTAKATEEVATQIGAIQSVAGDATEAIEQVSKIITEMSGIAANVASAVEEQNAAVATIAEGVNRASSEARSGAAAMTRVAGASTDARKTADDVKALAEELAGDAEQLDQEVRRFLSDVRAA
jgi:methyl-accepting chemotaxis protein